MKGIFLMKTLKITSILAFLLLTSVGFAQADAPESNAVKDDRSYLADFEGKKPSIYLFEEAAKKEIDVTLKTVGELEVIFSSGTGGDISISKKSASAFKVMARPDENWPRARTALGRQNWEEAIMYMRPFVYPLLQLSSINEETFKANGYIEMYISTLLSAGRIKEATALAGSIHLNECAPSLVTSVLEVAIVLAKEGNTKDALSIINRANFSGAYAVCVPDMLNALAELRKHGATKECSTWYTKLYNIETNPRRNECGLWMIYCDLILGNKLSAEVYFSKIEIDRKSPEFSLKQMVGGLMKVLVEKPDYAAALNLYSEGIVFGSNTSEWMPELLYNAGMAYKKLNQPVPANEIFAQMGALYPSDAFTAKGLKEIVKIEKKVEKKKSDDDDDE